MKFETFIHKKRATWNRLNLLVQKNQSFKNAHHEELSEMIKLYRSVCADYAYARTNYPYDRIVQELSSLLGKVHQVIYGSKRLSWKALLLFFTHTFPQTFRLYFSYTLWATILFLLGGALSFLGSFENPNLPEYFLGDTYVHLTLTNIDGNDPFAIYKRENSPVMSSFIMTNNIKVTFFTYGMGIFAGIGSVLVLFYNGLILGVFFFIFFKHHLLMAAFLTVMLHGAIELTCIFIAGGAGLMIGKALLFPGSFSRKDALQFYGMNSIKLIIGIAPMLVLAGIIEGFVTRIDMDLVVKSGVVLADIFFLVWYLGIAGREIKKPIKSMTL